MQNQWQFFVEQIQRFVRQKKQATNKLQSF